MGQPPSLSSEKDAAALKAKIDLRATAKTRRVALPGSFRQDGAARLAALDLAAILGPPPRIVSAFHSMGAALRNHPVVPAFIHREAGGRSHRIEILPALTLEPGAAEDEEVLRRNLQRVTGTIEAAIRAWPGQWTWTHRRWRTRPRSSAAVSAGSRSGPNPG